MQLVFSFEAGILISLPVRCDKILSLALIRIWLSLINILHTSTASSPKSTGWKATFGVSPALSVQNYYNIFFLLSFLLSIKWPLVCFRLMRKALLLHTNNTFLSYTPHLCPLFWYGWQIEFWRNKKCLSGPISPEHCAAQISLNKP